MGLDKLWEVKKRIEQINQNSGREEKNTASIKKKFEERHKRVTLYLENDVYDDLQKIREQGVSQSLVVNLAIKEFITRNWPEFERT